MARHFNPSIANRAARILNSKQGDYLSDEVAGPVAIIPITPFANICKSASTTTSAAIYTTPADKDFYLTSCSLSGAKAVGDSGTSAVVAVTVSGLVANVLLIAGITLTADAQSVAIAFPVPIKVDRGTAINCNIGGTWTSVRAAIQGYTEEVTKD